MMAITAIGILYFYITLRGPDVEARHKVLWFFEAHSLRPSSRCSPARSTWRWATR